jgi:16S rRNA (uracil1498-N3)-methyltransferase
VGAPEYNICVRARFFAPDAHATGAVIALPDDEAEHLTRVLRLQRGDDVIVFNGQGLAFEATVESARKDGAEVLLGPRCDAAPEPRVAVTLIQAVLKGDKMDDVVRDAVMIGVAAIQPIVATRSEVTHASIERSRRRDRWERIAVSSAKQCGRAVVPVILEPQPFEAVPTLVDERRLPGPALMLVEPTAAAEVVSLGELDVPPPREVSVLVGPEGGWTPAEIAAASEQCRLITLGGRTIRGDAMALVAVASLFTKWGEY